MRIKLMVSLLCCGFLLLSCQEDEVSKEYPIEAEVLGRNMDCGIYAIKILNGLAEVSDIVGPSMGTNIYIAKNLPSNLEIEGLRIKLDVRPVQPNELSPCTALGPGYNWLYVKQAKKK